MSRSHEYDLSEVCLTGRAQETRESRANKTSRILKDCFIFLIIIIKLIIGKSIEYDSRWEVLIALVESNSLVIEPEGK